MVNRTGMGGVFFGNLVSTPRSRKMSSSGREFSDEDYFAILIEVKLLGGKVDYNGRAGLRLQGREGDN
jgi:hypothetical protein